MQQSRRQLRNQKILVATCCALAWIGITHPGRAASPSEPAPQPATLSTLQERLARFLSEPRFASAQWGVKVVSLDTGITLFEHNSNRLLKPASNAKLYTGALALDRLGPDHRIHTSLLATREVSPSGTLDGDLIVLGRGDFSMAARFNEGDHSRSLEPLVNVLVNAGVKQIRGDVIGDESYFQGPPFGHGWTWDDLQHYYGAQVSALSVNDNVVDLVFRPGSLPGEPCRISTSPETTFLRFLNRTRTVEAGGSPTIRLYRPLGENVVYASGTLPVEGTRHVDSVTVHHPARWFVALFHEALRERGIHVSGRLHTANWLDRQTQPLNIRELVELGSTLSRPMSELTARMMKDSQNLYAQLLLLQVGARSRSRDRHPTTEAAGLAEMGEFLEEMGIARSEVLLEEGSGLSRGALLTPDATVRLLLHMTRHPMAHVFRDSLPVAGVDGTLRRRLAGTVAAGNVHAKTGALRYVNTLSGYGRTAGGENLAFSLMLNNYREPHPAHSGRNEIDALLVMLMEFPGRSRDAEGEPLPGKQDPFDF